MRQYRPRREPRISIDGRVQAGGGAVAGSTVTLWAASAGEPRQLGHARTGTAGPFSLRTDEAAGGDISLYVVANGGEATVGKASGDNPAITFLTVLGNKAPAEHDGSHLRPKRGCQNPEVKASNGSVAMFRIGKNHIAALLLANGLLGSTCAPAAAGDDQ